MVSAPRSKSLLSWEPFPYLLLLVLILLTGVVGPQSAPWLLWPLMLAIALVLLWLFIAIANERKQGNPNQWGELSSLDGLDVVDALAVARNVHAVAVVADSGRHRNAIELARLNGGIEQAAVLVPRSSRWLSLRYRIGVQLTGDIRPRHAGFLSQEVDDRWRELLDAAKQRGRYYQVPARIIGEKKPFGVELDLSGLVEVAEMTGLKSSEVD